MLRVRNKIGKQLTQVKNVQIGFTYPKGLGAFQVR